MRRRRSQRCSFRQRPMLSLAMVATAAVLLSSAVFTTGTHTSNTDAKSLSRRSSPRQLVKVDALSTRTAAFTDRTRGGHGRKGGVGFIVHQPPQGSMATATRRFLPFVASSSIRVMGTENESNRRLASTTSESVSSSSPSTRSSSSSTSTTSAPTLYDILGASSTATRAELKERYLALARLTHPDAMNHGSSAAATGRGRDDDDVGTRTTSRDAATGAEFSEIAAAWKLLSNPKLRKRYDRSLQAKQFSETVTQMASNFVDQAAASPTTQQFLQDTFPFLRRTTVTTLATLQAAAQELTTTIAAATATAQPSSQRSPSTTHAPLIMEEAINADESRNSVVIDVVASTQLEQTIHSISNDTKTLTQPPLLPTNPLPPADSNLKLSASPSTAKSTSTLDFTRSIHAAWEAGQRASRIVDGMELEEKAAELLQQAQAQATLANQVNHRLRNITATKLAYLLEVDGAPLTSVDALCLWQKINQNHSETLSSQSKPTFDKLSVWDQMLMRQSVLDEIRVLQQSELSFEQILHIHSEIQADYQASVHDRRTAELQLTEAIYAEEQARLAWQTATRHVTQQRMVLGNTTRVLAEREASLRQAAANLQRHDRQLQKQQHKVQSQLRDKEKLLIRQSVQAEQKSLTPVALDTERRDSNLVDEEINMNYESSTSGRSHDNESKFSGTVLSFMEDIAISNAPRNDPQLGQVHELEMLQRAERQLRQEKEQIQRKIQDLVAHATQLQSKADEISKSSAGVNADTNVT